MLVASLGLFFLYISPTYTGDTGNSPSSAKTITELRSVVADYDRALLTMKQIEEVRGGLLKQFNDIAESDRTRIAKLLPDYIDSVRLILDLNNVASKYGMSLSNITIADGVAAKNTPTSARPIGPDNKKYDSMNVSFTLAGKYDSFVSFVKDVERSLRLVDIISVSFTAAADESYKYDVGVRTYRLK